MSAYLFVHFREKTTPDGEQVYFALSKDGFNWETVNEASPVLWTYYGTKGARDFTIIRDEKTAKFYILATDLSISYGSRKYRENFWGKVSQNGSQYLSIWESEDLLEWTEQRLISFEGQGFGCLWAPDVIYDAEHEEFILHWSSTHSDDNYTLKGIYYSRTKDFKKFTSPKILYKPDGVDSIDSAIYQEADKFYLFVKSSTAELSQVRLLVSDIPTGDYELIEHFDRCMDQREGSVYEAPTATQLDDGRWCLFLDYFGKPGAEQGYVPFVADKLEGGNFIRADESFNFPYGFKHGTILKITDVEYESIKQHDWSDKGYI